MVEIPQAEPAVARHRERLAASARLGIPAHITVLSPFMPPRAIGPVALARLEYLFAALSRFRFQLDRTAWFGDEVLWLAPPDPGPLPMPGSASGTSVTRGSARQHLLPAAG